MNEKTTLPSEIWDIHEAAKRINGLDPKHMLWRSDPAFEIFDNTCQMLRAAIEQGELTLLPVTREEHLAHIELLHGKLAADRERKKSERYPQHVASYLWPEAVIAWAKSLGFPQLSATSPQAATDESAPPPAAESIVLNVSENANGMTLTANGKEIRFRASKDKPTKEMQIVRVLIAEHPKGATAHELLVAGWPGQAYRENLDRFALRLISAIGTLRGKARKRGLPENIFPVVSKKSIYDGARFALTCRAIEGAEEFRRLNDWQRRALPVNNEILSGEEEET